MVWHLLTGLHDRARFWNVTEAERRLSYPCDVYAEADWEIALRGIDVAAPVETTFRGSARSKLRPTATTGSTTVGAGARAP